MDNLTEKERVFLNTRYHLSNKPLHLGTKFQEIIGALFTEGSPVNAVNAGKVLTISGVVIDGETVTINNPAVSGTDVYEFLADTEQTKTNLSNIAVDITSHTIKASRTLTLDTQPTSGDKMTIGSKIFTFVPVGTDTADGEISIGTDLATAQAAIVAAINGTDEVNEPHSLVSAGDFANNFCIITALVGGVAGDIIATTETFTAGTNIFAGVSLAGGSNCSATNAVTELVSAITAHDTQGVGAVDGNGDTVELTADIAGIIGNAIIIGKSMANGAFAGGATLLSGGVDGTVGVKQQTMMDATYLYRCVADNTTSGKNWRRITLGAVY